MRIHCKLAIVCLLTLVGFTGVAGRASGAGLSPAALSLGAHVSPRLAVADYLLARGQFCHSVHVQCRLDAGHGFGYRACMRRRGCFPRHVHDQADDFIDFEYRRKGYSCRHWYRECLDNWHYREDVIGCLRYYGCDRGY